MGDSTARAAWFAAWAAAFTAAVTIALVLIATWQVLEGRGTRREQSRPYVIVDFEFRSFLIYLAIKNIGTTMARNVRITFDKPLDSTFSRPREIDDSRLFKEPIPMIAPGRQIRILFDSFQDRVAKPGLPMAYTVTIHYQDTHGRHYREPPYPLDLGIYVDTALEPKGLPELVDEVERLRKETGKWTDGIRGLRVAVLNREKDERQMGRPAIMRRVKDIRRKDGWRASARWYLDLWLHPHGWR